MGQSAVGASDEVGEANPGFRLTLGFVLVGKFCRGPVVRLARQSPMKSIVAISKEGSSVEVVSSSSAIQRFRLSSEKHQ